MKAIVKYFAQKNLIINLLLFGVIFGAIGLWGKIGKEEYPDTSMPWLRFTIPYPGASAEDVELFVTKPIEERLKELTGLYEINATSSYGSATFRITVEHGYSDFETDEIIREIKDAVARTELPRETEDPLYRRFSTAQKAIIDIGLYYKGKRVLDIESRTELQKFALALKNRILTLPEISGIEDRGYLKPELQILIDPAKLRKFDISLDQIRNQLLAQHVRMPAGNMEDRGESEVSFLSELDNVEALENMIVRGGFEGQKIRLKEVGKVQDGFERNKTVLKVQGHEGILYSIRKSASVDILTAQKVLVKFVDDFMKANPESPINLVLIDDESYGVRNRLSIIGWNGTIGFFLILLVLFVFLDLKSSIWVAAGLPFTLAFTLICALLMGYTVNNITLAGIIIVLGIVVDDAIIVAENISRLRRNGINGFESVIEGTARVTQPIIASVLTTCAAFIPLYFFSGHFSQFIVFIPAIVFLMLGASLIESFLILPGHLHYDFSRLSIFRFLQQTRNREKSGHWFFLLEKKYSGFLQRVLKYRFPIILIFIFLLLGSYLLFKSRMKFVMFPREEAEEITVRVKGPDGVTRYEMAAITKPLEEMFLSEREAVISVMTFIGQSRRGGEVREDEATLRVELKPPSERRISLARLLSSWENKSAKFDNFTEIRFLKTRWGSDSGSPIEFEVQENSDSVREKVVLQTKELLERHPEIINVEIERPVQRREYRLTLKPDSVFVMGINPSEVGRSLRAFVEGHILYTLNKGEEEVDVRLTSHMNDKQDIESILALKASNEHGYLVPYRNFVNMEETTSPGNIQRINYRRTTKIYADIKEDSKTTPLEIAAYLEQEVFPKVSIGNPNTVFEFRGEIRDSRESQADFGLAIILSLGIIYFLLVVLYNSLAVPFLIGAIIPFGIVGVILSFLVHGMEQYGFFAVIGTLGMLGVVINDSVVMVSKLESTPDKPASKEDILAKVSDISASRLRAVVVTTLTTVAGIFPTAYGWVGYDSMLAEMMLAMAWGLIFGTVITLLLVPCIYSFYAQIRWKRSKYL